MDRVRFQLDEHLPTAWAEGLRRRGIDVRTAAEAGLLGAPDEDVLDRAHAAVCVIVTYDRDYLRLHRDGHAHSGIGYCAQGARTVGQLVASLALIHELLEAAEMAGRGEFL